MKKLKNNFHLPGFYKLVIGRDGVFLANKNDIYVGNALLKYGEFSHFEMRTFSQLIPSPDITLIEIGANIGAHTVGLSRMVKKLIAFEPQPQVFYNLCANIALNSIQNVECYNVGLGAEEGTLYLPYIDHSKKNNFGGIELQKEGEYKIPVKTLDSYQLTPQFIKIDVEGMEEEVIYGAFETINNNRPIMYIENDRVNKSQSLIEALWRLEYRLYWDNPKLFNPDNFFEEKENIYPNIVSVNMICIPNEQDSFNIPNLITDSRKHPFA